jgi:hypothetical protein
MTGVMPNDTAVGNWPQVRTAPLMLGGILVGVGTAIVLAGFAVAGTHVGLATRAWIKELETPPSQLARLRWEQAKAAMSAGATTWQAHPNAQVHVQRRTPARMS